MPQLVRAARKLTHYISYALFCAFTLVDVAYAGVQLAKQYVTVLEANNVKRHAQETLDEAKRDARERLIGQATVRWRARQGQQAELAYAQTEHENDVRVMGWSALAVGWLLLLSLYFEEVHTGSTVIALGICGLGILFARAFLSAYGAAIWHWLSEPVAGHTHGVWLLGAAAAALSAAAIYYDFFRSTPVTAAE